jgi:hypothetical protein
MASYKIITERPQGSGVIEIVWPQGPNNRLMGGKRVPANQQTGPFVDLSGPGVRLQKVRDQADGFRLNFSDKEMLLRVDEEESGLIVTFWQSVRAVAAQISVITQNDTADFLGFVFAYESDPGHTVSFVDPSSADGTPGCRQGVSTTTVDNSAMTLGITSDTPSIVKVEFDVKKIDVEIDSFAINKLTILI